MSIINTDQYNYFPVSAQKKASVYEYTRFSVLKLFIV